MADDLNGKAALITGGGTGIGEAAALALAAKGVAVAVTGRRREKLEGLVGRISADGGKAIAIQSDVAVEADALRAVREAAEQLGRLDIVVNSAGINEYGGVQTLDLASWRRVIDINLMGTIYTCAAAVPILKAAGGGDIVNISSTSGRRAAAAFASYSTSKHGVQGFSESLRQEVGGIGIRVCIIEPGATESEIASSVSDPKAREFMHKHVTKEGAMKASDIADAIVFVVGLPPRANVSTMLVRPTIDTAGM
ncbi:MAG: SDR family NAD(P)-dependent oxidoreductase [Novosphingobium sp.]